VDSVVYFARIEGIANSAGQLRLACRQLPDYADDETWIVGLAQAPTGVSAAWDLVDHRVSVGRISLELMPTAGEDRFWRVRARPLSELTAAVTAGGTSWPVAPTTRIAFDDVLYCDRETVHVTGITVNGAGEVTAITVVRGFGGSTAAIHSEGADLHPAPPALTGRRVTVYETPRAGGSAVDEIAILRGYCAGELASGIHWARIDCVDRFGRALLNRDPVQLVTSEVRITRDGEPAGYARVARADGSTHAPRYRSDRAAIYHQRSGLVELFRYVAGPPPEWKTNPEVLWAAADFGGPLDGRSFELAYANTFGDSTGETGAPPFGYTPDGGALTYSDHPIDIALNLLVSLDTTNKTAGRTNYDLGARLYPHLALGLPIGDIDQEAFGGHGKIFTSGRFAGLQHVHSPEFRRDRARRERRRQNPARGVRDKAILHIRLADGFIDDELQPADITGPERLSNPLAQVFREIGGLADSFFLE